MSKQLFTLKKENAEEWHEDVGACAGAVSPAPARPTLAQDEARPQTPHGPGLPAIRVRDAAPWPKASTSICGETTPPTSRLQQPAPNNTYRLRHGPRGHTHRRHTCPKTDVPQPGDHSPLACVPCLSFCMLLPCHPESLRHCLSMQTTVVCVGACVPAYVRVHAYARV